MRSCESLRPVTLSSFQSIFIFVQNLITNKRFKSVTIPILLNRTTKTRTKSGIPYTRDELYVSGKKKTHLISRAYNGNVARCVANLRYLRNPTASLIRTLCTMAIESETKAMKNCKSSQQVVFPNNERMS